MKVLSSALKATIGLQCTQWISGWTTNIIKSAAQREVFSSAKRSTFPLMFQPLDQQYQDDQEDSFQYDDNLDYEDQQQQQQQQQQQEQHEIEEEWQASEPGVTTTPQLLATLWNMIVHGSQLDRGESRTILFPGMAEYLEDPEYVEALMGHLDVCKDVCDNFGIHTLLVPEQTLTQRVIGFTVKSYKSDRAYNANEEGEYDFEPDPMWDDVHYEPMFNFEALPDDNDPHTPPMPEIDWTQVDKEDKAVVQFTKEWVKRMMSDLALCPFTNGSDRAGLPMGPVFYTVERAQTVEETYRAYWREVVRVEQATEQDLSTTLLILPEFALHNVEAFENVCNTLTQPMETLAIENLLQLVFFHPKWSFRDGAARKDQEGTDTLAANYARRSPWPMINILRTKQVRAAQRGIPTGLVYQQNEKTLSKVGSNHLEAMLRTRDWADLEDQKVDRRDMEALRVAQDYQLKGHIAQEDLSLQTDSTPAVNKVNKSQVEAGDMVNVICQALAKRLGKPVQGIHTNGQPQRLSGAETSAVLMASDFLIQELDRIILEEQSA